MSKTSFNSINKPFASTLRARVNDYFKTRQLANTGNRKLYIKSVTLVTTAIALYIILLALTMPIWLSCLLCVLLGINFAAIGFNIMHEGGHQSFSKSKLLNSISAYSLNKIGRA